MFSKHIQTYIYMYIWTTPAIRIRLRCASCAGRAEAGGRCSQRCGGVAQAAGSTQQRRRWQHERRCRAAQQGQALPGAPRPRCRQGVAAAAAGRDDLARSRGEPRAELRAAGRPALELFSIAGEVQHARRVLALPSVGLGPVRGSQSGGTGPARGAAAVSSCSLGPFHGAAITYDLCENCKLPSRTFGGNCGGLRGNCSSIVH